MFVVFPRNDHVHEIECDIMLRNKKMIRNTKYIYMFIKLWSEPSVLELYTILSDNFG